MPANLPPQYYELERAFKVEKDPKEKLRMAEELLRIMPKHKGTDKLQAEMKAKISQLKTQAEQGTKEHGAKHAPTHDHIEREGAGQIILIGAPNAGKSSLLDALTHAKPMIGDYPYTTREPLTGMMTFETIQIQLIDTPPISDELYEPYLSNLIRNADVAVLVCDVTDPTLESKTDFILHTLGTKNIALVPGKVGHADDPRLYPRRTVIGAHKANEDDSSGLEYLKRKFAGFAMTETSILDDASMSAFRRALFDSLEIVRVYTKQIGKEVALVDPVVLPIGATVLDAAESIHKDFAANLKFARIWGKGLFEGQRVQRDHVLQDGDVVEFHV
jgi:small GTP-binding protein